MDDIGIVRVRCNVVNHVVAGGMMLDNPLGGGFKNLIIIRMMISGHLYWNLDFFHVVRDTSEKDRTVGAVVWLLLLLVDNSIGWWWHVRGKPVRIDIHTRMMSLRWYEVLVLELSGAVPQITPIGNDSHGGGRSTSLVVFLSFSTTTACGRSGF